MPVAFWLFSIGGRMLLLARALSETRCSLWDRHSGVFVYSRNFYAIGF